MAAWVAPMVGPPICDGGVVFAGGRILAVGSAETLRSEHLDAQLIDRTDSIVLPGLVNAHTHLELSGFACGQPPASFLEWILKLVPRSQLTAEIVRDSVTRGVPLGIAQCLHFGVTTVGDISRHCAVSRPILRDSPLRVVSYGEVQAMAQRRSLLVERIEIAIDDSYASDRLRIGLTPHAPYSVEIDAYRRCLEVARGRSLPLATHLAETPHEATFLASHSGPFRELWEQLRAWDGEVPRFAGGPIRFAQAVGLLDYPTLLAHVNYCDDAEMDLLSRGRASVVYCPRTHAYFGHPPHRWRDMRARGINVAIGTDSCASSPDLNVVDELRLLHRIAPNVPAIELWQVATTHAARAIGWDDRVGSLAAGKSADFAVFPSTGGDPLAAILESAAVPHEVWIAGDRIQA